MDMLKTEMRNPKTTHLDRMTTTEMLRVIQDENMNAVKAVDGCLGAGTSGRLGVLDASEACPTFGVPEGTIRCAQGDMSVCPKGHVRSVPCTLEHDDVKVETSSTPPAV